MVRIFKTDVTSKSQIRKLHAKLNRVLWFALWNFDLEDRDRILRVEYPEHLEIPIAESLRKIGISCVELH